MTAFTLDDLSRLPRPDIIETMSAEAIIAARKQRLVDLAPSYGLAYDVQDLETDPAVVLLEESAYEEVLLRARGNDIARARYLYFARGAEIDHLGAFYDCERLAGEADDRYKARIILAIQGRSTGGTAPRYRYVAMSASLRVADAVVYTDGIDPTVHVAVFAADNNGVADEALLATVRAALADPAVRMVSDTLDVRSAVVQTVAVAADIWLLPSASESIVTGLQVSVPAAWAAIAGLGRDLTLAWLTSALMAPGVHRVAITAPAADVVMSPYEAVRISSLTLTLRGRDF